MHHPCSKAITPEIINFVQFFCLFQQVSYVQSGMDEIVSGSYACLSGILLFKKIEQWRIGAEEAKMRDEAGGPEADRWAWKECVGESIQVFLG